MSTAPTDDMVHVTRWHWGSKEWSPFSATEMERRQTELRNHMAAARIDASAGSAPVPTPCIASTTSLMPAAITSAQQKFH